MNKALINLVEKIAEPFWTEVRENYLVHQCNLLEQYRKDVAEKIHTDPWKLYKNQLSSSDYLRNILYPLIEKTSNSCMPDVPYRVKADVEAIMERMADRSADETVASFKDKLLTKLEGIIGKGSVECEITGNLGRNYIQVKLTDTGLQFGVLSQIVSVWPWNATPHHRYPTTFHEVKVGNDVKGAKLSEREVKTLAYTLRGEEVPKDLTTEQKREKSKGTRQERSLEAARKDVVSGRKSFANAKDPDEKRWKRISGKQQETRLRNLLKKYGQDPATESLMAKDLMIPRQTKADHDELVTWKRDKELKAARERVEWAQDSVDRFTKEDDAKNLEWAQKDLERAQKTLAGLEA